MGYMRVVKLIFLSVIIGGSFTHAWLAGSDLTVPVSFSFEDVINTRILSAREIDTVIDRDDTTFVYLTKELYRSVLFLRDYMHEYAFSKSFDQLLNTVQNGWKIFPYDDVVVAVQDALDFFRAYQEDTKDKKQSYDVVKELLKYKELLSNGDVIIKVTLYEQNLTRGCRKRPRHKVNCNAMVKEICTLSVDKDDKGFFILLPTCEKVYLHKLGENPENDELIFQRPDMKELGFGMQISNDDRYLVIYGYLGSSRKNEVYFKDLNNHGEIDTLISGFNNYYEGDIIDSILYLRTNENAPNFKIIAINLKNPNPDSAKEIISESDDMLSSFAIINNMLVVKYLHNAHSRVKIFDINGSFIKELEFPTLGSVGKPTGRWKDDEMFLSFSSFTYPRTIYRYDFNTGVLTEIYRDPVKVDPSGYVTKQVWYNSKDGTPVSMFIVHKEGMNLNGNNPALLTGYGGFTINETPYFSSSNYIWLENGGIFCLPNLRGGGEYGEKWHRDGMLENKQNVFDDFIAAAEWLISQGYTSPEKLAIRGGSNGGLLVGAALVQRPDLFKAVICSVPLLDMVRYHKFLIARYWIPEYGSSEDPEQFEYIYAYSPYHHVVKGTAYPAVFLKAGESDMRVHPSHARKMAAALQNATSSEAPILLDIERKTGHGQGQPISMQIEKYADNYAFLFWQLGIGK